MNSTGQFEDIKGRVALDKILHIPVLLLFKMEPMFLGQKQIIVQRSHCPVIGPCCLCDNFFVCLFLFCRRKLGALDQGEKRGEKSPWAKLEKSVLNHMIENLEKLTHCDFYNVNVKTQITELQLKVTKRQNPQNRSSFKEVV